MQATPDDDRYMSLLEAALVQPDSTQREGFLSAACASDPALAAQIRDDVEWHERMGDFLQRPLLDRLDGSSRPFVAGDLVADRFRIIREVGEGGMGVVYEALDEKLNERRALKCARLGFRHRLSPEASNALRVTHDNICRVHEIHTAITDAGPLDVLSMEFLEGETLYARLRRGRPDPAEARTIARQLTQGLAAAHREGVLHGDLKSTNVMLTRSVSGGVRAVITDFGLATSLSGDASAALSSALRGHPGYVAPERYKGSPSSVRSDIYSLGAILYELVAGRAPFDSGVTWQQRLERQPSAPGSVAGGVARGWNRVIQRCLDPDPAKRFASADELLAAIGHLNRWLWRVGFMLLAVLLLVALTRVPAVHDRLFPPPPPVRLAILPFTDTRGDEVTGEVLGSLEHVSASLSSLPGSRGRLLVVPVRATLKRGVNPSELARLGATHVLNGSAMEQDGNLRVRAEVKEVGTGIVLRNYSAVLQPAEVGNLSTSLTGLVTSTFNLPSTLPAAIATAAAPLYWRGLNLLVNSSSDYEPALALFQQALGLDGSSPLIYSGLAQAFLQKYAASNDSQWLDRAGEAAWKAEALHPDSGRVQQVLSSLERARKVPSRALPHSERATQLDPGNPDFWLELAETYRLLGRFPDAIRTYQKAIALAPGYYAPHQDLGFALFQLGRYREAADQFNVIAALAPDLPEELAYAGAILLSAGRDGEAEAAVERSLRIHETGAAYLNLGVLRIYQLRDQEAAELFEKAVHLSPENALARINLADTQRRLGRAAEAKSNYGRAAAMLDASHEAFDRALLAHVRARLGDAKGARREAGQAVQLAPFDWQVIRWAILCYETLGDRQQSLKLVESAPAEVLEDLKRQPDLKRFSENPRFIQIRKQAK